MGFNPKSEVVIICGPRGCLSSDTYVKTDKGDLRMDEIKDNKILSYDFRYEKVKYIKPNVFNTGKKKIIKIHAREGVIKCSEDHKWFVFSNNKLIIKKTSELSNKDKLIYTKNGE